MASPFASKDGKLTFRYIDTPSEISSNPHAYIYVLYEIPGSRRSSLNEDEQPYAITNVDTKVNKFSSSAKQLQEILKKPTCKSNI